MIFSKMRPGSDTQCSCTDVTISACERGHLVLNRELNYASQACL